MFGPHLSPKFGCPRTWYLLCRFTSLKSRLFYNTAPEGVDKIACSDGLAVLEKRSYPLSQVPHSNPPAWMQYSWGYYTSALLDGVVQVIPCQTGSMPLIIGLLLKYADGTCDCVGQYRHDCLLPPVDVGDAPTLHLAFGRREGHFHHVAKVTVNRPPYNWDLVWLELPWHGLLEWWVGPEQVKIHHQDQESPCKQG